MKWASQMALVVKSLAASAGDKRDMGSIPGSGRSSGEGNGNPLQYSCLENPRDRKAWWASVHGIANSWTRVKCSIHIQFTCCDLAAAMKWNSESKFCSLTLYPNVALYFILSFYSYSVSGYHKNTLSKWAYFKIMKWSRSVRLFVTPWTVAYQAPQSMEFSRQEYWSGLPFPSPGDLPNPGIEPRSSALQADALPSEPPGRPILRQ